MHLKIKDSCHSSFCIGSNHRCGDCHFSLNMQSRETFFLVHYYYLDSAREQLAKSIQDESHDWIKNEMQSSESSARNILLERFINLKILL